MTTAFLLAVRTTYRVNGDRAVWTPDGGTPVTVKVIDNIADTVLAANGEGKVGAIALDPSVNMLLADCGDEPEGGRLELKGRTWDVTTSKQINEFEKQLTLREAS